jgi:hypothetical protein
MGFLVICMGITILQMSKVDPESLSKLDRRSTILLKAARSNTESVEEKSVTGFEDPGMDTLRGSFGTVGSIIRARSARRMSMSGGPGSVRYRAAAAARQADQGQSEGSSNPNDALAGMKRHQLYDAPVPRGSYAEVQEGKSPSLTPSLLGPNDANASNRRPTIKFDSQDMVHQYHPPGKGAGVATHEHRDVAGRGMPYPPMPPFGKTNTSEASPKLVGALVHTDIEGQQTLNLPPLLLSMDGETHSAPVTIRGKYPIQRRDSLDSKTPSTATLMSFPSITDSNANSQMPWYDDDEAESVRGRSKKQRYPKGSGDDDREESVSLWHRPPAEDEQPDDDPSQGGIRLVQPRKGY